MLYVQAGSSFKRKYDYCNVGIQFNDGLYESDKHLILGIMCYNQTVAEAFSALWALREAKTVTTKGVIVKLSNERLVEHLNANASTWGEQVHPLHNMDTIINNIRAEAKAFELVQFIYLPPELNEGRNIARRVYAKHY